MRVYNKETMLVLPTTSRTKLNKFHKPLEIQSLDKKTKEIATRTVYVKLTQARVISNKRLIRKVGVIDEDEFLNIQKNLGNLLKKSTPRIAARCLGGRSPNNRRRLEDDLKIKQNC